MSIFRAEHISISYRRDGVVDIGYVEPFADPLAAVKYRIVVMLMLSAANTIAIVMACYLAFRKRFAPDGYYLDRGIREDYHL